MKKLFLILLSISSINLPATQEEQPEFITRAKSNKHPNAHRIYTSYQSLNGNGPDGVPCPDDNFLKSYASFKQHDDGSITVSSHHKKHDRGMTTAVKHSVTIPLKTLFDLESLHDCYCNPQNDPQYCALVAGRTLDSRYKEIQGLIPLFFELIKQFKKE